MERSQWRPSPARVPGRRLSSCMSTSLSETLPATRQCSSAGPPAGAGELVPYPGWRQDADELDCSRSFRSRSPAAPSAPHGRCRCRSCRSARRTTVGSASCKPESLFMFSREQRNDNMQPCRQKPGQIRRPQTSEITNPKRHKHQACWHHKLRAKQIHRNAKRSEHHPKTAQDTGRRFRDYSHGIRSFFVLF